MAVDEIAQAAGDGSAENRTAARSLRAIIESGARRASPPHRDGQSAGAARSGAVDPLAELARLIDQDETFGAIVRDRRRSEQRVELSASREEPLPRHLARAGNPFGHDGDRDGGSPLVPSHLCDGPIGEHEPGGREGPDYSNGLPNERHGLKLFAALIGLALVGSASGMAYWAWSDGRVRGDEARLIGASVGPDKTMPSPQGEDNGARLRGQERSVAATGPLIAGAEKPVDAKPAATNAPPLGVVYGPAPTQVAALAPGAAAPESPAGPAQIQPPDVKQPAPAETAPGATEPTPAQGPGYIVQLSSQRSEAAAQATSRLLQTKYPDAFGGRQPSIRRSDLGDRGVYYRVQMGPFSIGEAKELCGNLKKSGADCVVQKN